MQFFYTLNSCTKSALETNHDIIISALQLIHGSINKYVTSRFQLKLKISLNFSCKAKFLFSITLPRTYTPSLFLKKKKIPIIQQRERPRAEKAKVASFIRSAGLRRTESESQRPFPANSCADRATSRGIRKRRIDGQGGW